jgi:hypothetical protein
MSNHNDRWEYEMKPCYDTEYLSKAYRAEMLTDAGRAIVDAYLERKRSEGSPTTDYCRGA